MDEVVDGRKRVIFALWLYMIFFLWLLDALRDKQQGGYKMIMNGFGQGRR